MKTTIISLLLAIAAACNAQTSISINQLKGTKWMITQPVIDDETETVMCLDSTYTVTVNFLPIKKIADATFKYYLSPSVPPSFDFSKVGKPTSGKFLIGYNDRGNKMFYYQIISFSPQKMVLLRKGKPYSIGGADDLYMTYKRVK
jgi:hypothetical protein